MGMRRRLALLGVVLVVSGCVPASAPTTPKVVKIVSSLPLQGPNRSQTVSIVNAIRLALEEQGSRAGDTIVEYESYDDASAERQTWDGAVEAANARKAASDRSVVAYIGPYNSGAARVSIPINCQADLVMVSPSNTYPGLTKSWNKDEPDKFYPGCRRNFARTVPSDDLQGNAAARWARELGVTKAYVLHDGLLYGSSVATAFRLEAKKLAIVELGYESVETYARPPDVAARATAFGALASKVAASGADLVYYGGVITNDLGFLLRELKQKGPAIRFMGPDGIYDPRFLQAAGADAVGTYLTIEGINVADYVGRPKAWAERYRARYGEDPGRYAIHGYEAAKAILAAIAKAGQRSDDRATVRDLVMATKDFDGVFGRWSFDEHGDTSISTFGGMKVTKAGKDLETTVEFQKELH